MVDLSFKVRKYEPKDRKSVLRICNDTGLWGKPIDPLFHDREIFANLIVAPYLKLEPEHSFVAEDNGKVVGYLLGSTKKDFELKAIPTMLKYASKMIVRCFGEDYRKHPKSIQFIKNMLKSFILKKRPHHPKGVHAHLHINLDEKYRSTTMGESNIGELMLVVYEDMLKQEGIKEYYGEVFSSENRRSEGLYRKLGFEIADKCETTMFSPEISDKLYMLCIHKKL